MSKSEAKARLPFRLFAGLFGVLLLAYLVHRAGPAKLLASMVTLGWGLGLVLAWGGVAHVVKTWAWRLTLLGERRHVSFARMLGLRLASEAVGQLGGLGQLFGEGLRVSLLGPAMPLATGITSVTIDRAFFILSAAVVSIVGLLAILIVLPLPHTLALYAGLFVFTLLGVVVLTAVAVRSRWPVLSGTAQIVGRIRYFEDWVERKHAVIHSVENNLLDFYHRTPGSFWASFALNLACHGAAVFEVFLILWLLGAKVSLFGALAIEALTKLVNIVGTFNPGNIGTYEGGNMLIVKIFGLTGATGLTLAFVRRMRAIFWAAVGGLCLVMLAKARKQRNLFGSGEDIMQSGPVPISPKESHTESDSTSQSHIAVILANNLGAFGFDSPMPEVGALPILLRSILGAHKAGAARIIVVFDRAKGPRIQHDLQRTGRLPRSVEWCDSSFGEGSLPSLFGQLASEVQGHLVLIAGDGVYHPSLHRRAGEWDGQGNALTLVTGSELVGICSLSREMAIDLSRRCPARASSIEDLLAWLTLTHSVESEVVPEDKWQRILNEQQRLLAEQKLNAWLVKPTDGIFARTNRRISIPISRQIIPYPITPNMVSLFTLGVSFAAGVFLALGGYWNMLTGAVLGWLSSVLDGCDGEVARLKLQESAFGCWLETMCDNLYYAFIFAGLTIGLVRSTGNRNYLLWGGLLLFGAIASFLTTGLQRHRMASGRPEQYLKMWHKEADSRSSNPFLYLGRHTEFIIRRCFLPYVFLFFALFHVMNWLLIGATLGANVVWMIALYSYLTFVPARASTVPSPAV
jgi:phosphatidylglycerophosphate synthase